MKNFLLITVGMTLIMTGCMSPKIALNGEGFTEMPVKGRNGFFIKQKLSFGDYKTTSVKRSWVKGSVARNGIAMGVPGTPGYENIVSFEYTKRRQTVNFSLSDGTQNSEVRCVTKFSSEDLIVGNNPSSIPNIIIDLIRGNRSTNTFYVQVFDGNEAKPWQLLLDNNAVQASPKKYVGAIALDDEHYYTIQPVYQMLDKKGVARDILFGSVGMDIRNRDNKSVATISMMDKGKVYLNTADKKEAFLLANIAAALLLQQQIDN
ncbi:MAG: hypothetical protein QM687_07610 [Ferruginibacter sp.]